ncbi:MAG: hypothetical protein ABR569_13185 [Gaiellaceae bacterium]
MRSARLLAILSCALVPAAAFAGAPLQPPAQPRAVLQGTTPQGWRITMRVSADGWKVGTVALRSRGIRCTTRRSGVQLYHFTGPFPIERGGAFGFRRRGVLFDGFFEKPQAAVGALELNVSTAAGRCKTGPIGWTAEVAS